MDTREAIIGILATLSVLLVAPSSYAAQTRIALVIGNSDYKNVSVLDNPKRDAALIGATLRDVGFQVTLETNADRRTMARAIRDFGQRLSAKGKSAVGLFYYAGHGVQAYGVNYLIPLNAPIRTEADLDIEAVSTAWVLGQMEHAGNDLNVVILDACRNNPFKLKGSFRSGTRGLAKMDAPRGSILAYAAGPGQVAADGSGQNSPYTKSLAKTIMKPGLKIEDVFKRVLNDVERATSNTQTPWLESSLRGDFYFVAPRRPAAADAPIARPAPRTDPSYQALFWDSIKDSDDPADFTAYLEQFPNGYFARLARNRLKRLKRKRTAALTPPKPRATQGPTISSQPFDPKLAEADLDLSRDERIRIQRGLKALRYLSGVPDGLFGNRTRSAIQRYQRKQGTTGTSYLTPDQAKALIAMGKETKVAVGKFPTLPSQTYKRTHKAGHKFRDCPECPRMVVIPSGKFWMGSPSRELFRTKNEGPQHYVKISRPVAMGRFEVTRGEFAAFIRQTSHKTRNACYAWTGKKWNFDKARNWRKPGFYQTDSHPVTCVSWHDAKAYVRWLSRRTGKSYRLPSEAEWEYAARAGTNTPFHTGKTITTRQANFHGGAANKYTGGLKGIYRGKTLPVGSFAPNRFGLYDVHGNVSELVDDCDHKTYAGAPKDGRVWTVGANCSLRVRRGGTWGYYAQNVRSARRHQAAPNSPVVSYGFRVARTLPR